MNYTFFILCLLHVTFSNAQRTANEKVGIVKELPASLLELTEDKTIFIEAFANDKKLADHSLNYNEGEFAFKKLKEDNYYPDYIASLELVFKPVEVEDQKRTDKDGNEAHRLVFTSKLEGLLHIMDSEKGLMHQEVIHLDDFSNPTAIVDNVSNYKFSSKQLRGADFNNSTRIFEEVSPINLKGYYKKDRKGQLEAKASYAKEVNDVQIYKLGLMAREYMKRAFFKTPYTEAHTFYTIKKFKGFDITPFNNAIQPIKEFAREPSNANKKQVVDAIDVWKSESAKLDLNERRQSRLYSDAHENIAKAYYLIDELDSAKFYTEKVRVLKGKPKYMTFYTKAPNTAQERQPSYQNPPANIRSYERYKKKDPNHINRVLGYEDKVLETHFNMYLVDVLTRKGGAMSPYMKKKIFVALNRAKPRKSLKKVNGQAYEALLKYHKEVKALFSKQAVDEFFSGKSFKSIQAELAGSTEEAFRAEFSRFSQEKQDLIVDLFDLYAQIILIRNNNGLANGIEERCKDLASRISPRLENLKYADRELFLEVRDLLGKVDSLEKVTNRSVEEVRNMKVDILRFCSSI